MLSVGNYRFLPKRFITKLFPFRIFWSTAQWRIFSENTFLGNRPSLKGQNTNKFSFQLFWNKKMFLKLRIGCWAELVFWGLLVFWGFFFWSAMQRRCTSLRNWNILKLLHCFPLQMIRKRYYSLYFLFIFIFFLLIYHLNLTWLTFYNAKTLTRIKCRFGGLQLNTFCHQMN